MLADVKPEVKPEVTDTGERDELAQHVKDFQARVLKANILAQVQAQAVPSQTIQTPQAPEELQAPPLATFGWTTLDRVATLPFVRRGSDCYVAHKIYTEQYLSHVHKVLSHLTTNCAYLLRCEMTQSEADVFNEINTQHCDKNLVGDYEFKAGDEMVRLEDVQISCKFFQACKNALCHNKIHNDLFGYVRISGETAVPFVWNDGQKLVPLFYFDGRSDYLESNSVELTDRRKLGYLKFCCLVQEIREYFYEHDSVKVVDIERVKELFHPDTPFELHWPPDPNQNLLAPEVRLAALHGMSESPLPVINTSRGSSTTPQLQQILNSPASLPITASVQYPQQQMLLNNSIPTQPSNFVSPQQNASLYRSTSPPSTFVPSAAHQRRNIQNSVPYHQSSVYTSSTTSVTYVPSAAHQQLNPNHPVASYQRNAVPSGYTFSTPRNIPPIQSSTLPQRIPNNPILHQQNPPRSVLPSSRTSATYASNAAHRQINPNYSDISHQQNIVPSGYTYSTPQQHRTVNNYNLCRQKAPFGCTPSKTSAIHVPNAGNQPNCSCATHQQRAAPSGYPYLTSSIPHSSTQQPPRILNFDLNQEKGLDISLIPVSDENSSLRAARTAGRKRSTDTVKDTSAKKHKGASCNDRQITNNVASISGDLTITPVEPRRNILQESVITNVPHRSPQTASSPEIRLHSPLMNEAAIVSPHAQIHVNPAAQTPHTIQGDRLQPVQEREINSALYRKLTQFLIKLVGPLDPRYFQCKIKEITFSFMMEEKMMSLQQQQNLASPIQREVNNLLMEMTVGKLQAMRHNSGCPPNHNQTSASRVNTTNVAQNHRPTTQVVEHIDMQWPDEEPYATGVCLVKGQEILGISISPIGKEFLVNLSQVILKCLKPPDYEKLYPNNFRELYQLNRVQQVQWDRLTQSRRVYCIGAYKDMFVRCSEVIEMLSK